MRGILGLVLCVALAPSALSQPQGEDRRVALAEELALDELVLIWTRFLDVPLEYDPTKLGGTVRTRAGLAYSAAELEDLVQRELVARGLTTVQPPGSESLRVVALPDAAALARVEASSLAGARAGFVKVILPLAFRAPDDIVEAVRLLVSKPHGVVTPSKESGALVVADLRPHVVQVKAFLDLFDSVAADPLIEEVEIRDTTSTAVAALIERINQTRRAVVGRSLRGAALALPESRSILVVAPQEEIDWWRATIERFDRPEPTVTEQYLPRRFGLAETARLLGALVPEEGQAEIPWKLVQDELTGSLYVTTTPSRHAKVKSVLARLETAEQEPRRPMRAFSIRHRRVSEVRDMLEKLLDAGVLDQPEAGVEAEPAAQGATAPLPAATQTVSKATTRSGDVTLTADEGTNRLLAFGEAPLLDELGRLIAQIDVRHAQVLIEAIVVSLNETQTRDLGVELRKVGVIDGVQYEIASLFGLGSTAAQQPTLPPVAGGGFAGAVLDPGRFSAIVRALETLNKGRSLTRPKVLVSNNEQATLDSTLQTPFVSTNASDTVATTSFGGTFDAGTSIQVKPQIADGDQIVLDYTVSISSFTGASTDPTLPPPRQENKLQSVVTIPDGHTVVVGGLEIESKTRGDSRVPLLGSIPILGHLFRDQTASANKTRFFVFLRCDVMKSRTFEDLKYRSGEALDTARVDDGWPKLEPRVIR